MDRVPLFFGDACSSVLGVMMLPDDPARAEGFAAELLRRGPLQNYMDAGFAFDPDELRRLLVALGPERPSDAQTETRADHGRAVGEVVKVLWALICSHPDRASVDLAIRIVALQLTGSAAAGERASFRLWLSEMRPVLHLWGAFAIRGWTFSADPTVGYSGMDDLSAFMGEAMTLRRELLRWRDGRRLTGQTLISDSMLGPWLGWTPFEPRAGWPLTGGLAPLAIPEEIVPRRLKPGRKPNVRPAAS